MLIFFWKSGGTGISEKHHWKLQLCMLQGGLFRGRLRPFISRVYLLLSKSPGWMLLTQKESWRLFNFTFRLPWGYLLLVAFNTKPFGQRPQGMQGRGKMVQLCQQIENHWFGMGEPPKFKTQRDSGLSVTLNIKMLVKDPWRQFEVKLSQWREIFSILQISVSTKRKWKYLLSPYSAFNFSNSAKEFTNESWKESMRRILVTRIKSYTLQRQLNLVYKWRGLKMESMKMQLLIKGKRIFVLHAIAF